MPMNIGGVNPRRIRVITGSGSSVGITKVIDAPSGIIVWEQEPIDVFLRTGSKFAYAGSPLVFPDDTSI